MSYYNLKAEIIKRNLSYRDLAIQLNISEEALIEKINKKKIFNYTKSKNYNKFFLTLNWNFFSNN